MKVLLYTDGGSLGNPGPGYGSYCIVIEGHPPSYGRENFGSNCTNNEAEYKALISGLARVKEYNTQIELEIRLDSALLVGHLSKNWRVKAINLRPLYQKALTLLNEFRSYQIVKVPREEVEIVLGH